jgi:uncharacterized protein YmfQ (DUF2313 family)/photosystem II stability/assembly factor-like uncharacterized protein
MPVFVDTTAEAKPVSQGSAVVDVVHYGYTRPLQDLLPPGRAYSRRADTALTRLLTAKGMERSRIQRRAQLFLRECDPATALVTLDAWETLLGLPDCEVPTTLEARRLAAAEKLAATVGHLQNLSFWTALFAKFGYELELLDFGALLLDCEDECDDPVLESLWRLVLWFLTEPGEYDALLACRVEAERLLGMGIELHLAWQQVEEGAYFLHSVCSDAAGATLAVGDSGLVLLSGGYLLDWEEIDIGMPDDSKSMFCCCAVADILFIADEDQNTYRSIDSGTTWEVGSLNGGLKFGASRGPEDDQVLVVVGAAGEIRRSTDAGLSWGGNLAVNGEDLYGVTAATGAMVAVGESGTIVRSINNGATWGAVVSPVATNLRAVNGRGLVVLAVGDGGVVLRSADAGATWSVIDIGLTTDLTGITATRSTRWVLCGAAALIASSVDEGVNWEVQDTNAVADLRAACASVPFGFAVLVGTDGAVIVEA